MVAVKQVGAPDLVLEAARALEECPAELGWEAEELEHERDFRPQRVGQERAGGLAKEVALEAEQVGEVEDQEAGWAQRELATDQGGARGLATTPEKARVAAAECLEARMTNRFTESCTRWRRSGALERVRTHPRLRWSFRIRCRNCLAKRKRR